MPIPSVIPSIIPGAPSSSITPPLPASDPFSLYDVSFNGVGFEYANTTDNPNLRITAPFEKTRIDQETTPGEQTLTNWWFKSQDSFHCGAGQLQLEPPVPTPVDHVRFDASKNVDVWTPGRVTRLPDVTLLTADAPIATLGITTGGVDAIVYLLSTGVVKMFKVVAGTTSTFTQTGVKAIATDGSLIFAATLTGVLTLDPANVTTAVSMYTYTSATTGPVLGWVKSRLMLAQTGGVYQLDIKASAVALSATQLLYQSPSPGYTWRAFSDAPTAILAAGDVGGVSVITSFTIATVSGAPVLQPNGDVASMPIGEKILSLLSIQGSFLGIGTTRGFRIGIYDSLYGRLTYGPLTLSSTDPTIACNALVARLGYVFAVGLAYDEAGLIRIDVGSKTDNAGRYAWCADLITPSATTTPAVAACVLPLSGQIAFSVPGVGIHLEGVGAGTGREAWLRTSRIRYGTVEPKLFKLGRVRGGFANGEITVSGVSSLGGTSNVLVGFTTVDPDEFRLPSDAAEWLQLTFTLIGATTKLTSYSVKALPGTRRQRDIQMVLSVADAETSRTGQRVRNLLSSRARLNALEAMDAAGDEVLLQEFTPSSVISTLVVIQKLSFNQIGRPGRMTDIGGTVTVVARTVE